jgi:aminoglycoside 6'-N-acetyltransferase
VHGTAERHTFFSVILTGERVVLRPGAAADVERLTSILNEPEVASRWGSFDEHQVAKQFVGRDTVFVIEVEGEVVGAIQYDEEDDPMYRRSGIDIFVATDHQRRGLGPDAIRTLARHLIEARGHHRLSIDPAADNRAAIAAYEKVGFRSVGVMRAYERGPDGTWHDGLLMDLLAQELTERSAGEDAP